MADTLPSLLAELDAALEDDHTARAMAMECELKLGLLRDHQQKTGRKVASIRIRLDKLAREMTELVAAMSKETKP